jgi:rubredoxin
MAGPKFDWVNMGKKIYPPVRELGNEQFCCRFCELMFRNEHGDQGEPAERHGGPRSKLCPDCRVRWMLPHFDLCFHCYSARRANCGCLECLTAGIYPFAEHERAELVLKG